MGLTKESTLNQNAYKYHTFDVQIEHQRMDEERRRNKAFRFLKQKEKSSKTTPFCLIYKMVQYLCLFSLSGQNNIYTTDTGFSIITK